MSDVCSGVPTARVLTKGSTSVYRYPIRHFVFKRSCLATPDRWPFMRMRDWVRPCDLRGEVKMASLLKGLLGGQGPENQPSGAEIIEKLKNRYTDLWVVLVIITDLYSYQHTKSSLRRRGAGLWFKPVPLSIIKHVLYYMVVHPSNETKIWELMILVVG